MEKLIMYGASFVDAIRVVQAINAKTPTWDIVGFIDDNPGITHSGVCNYPILGNYEDLKAYVAKYPDVSVFNNVNPSIAIHKQIGLRLDALHVKVPSLVHPDVDIGYVTIGKGVFVPQGCILGCNAVIGNYVTFRYGVIVSHDVKIDDYVFIGPGSVCTSGAVVGKETYLGACCTVINSARIGENCTVGAATLVNKNIRAGSTVVGVPARELKK
jgi:sugar O-acyltransferase (sialic acid O-acetyltransferase NeuD family)